MPTTKVTDRLLPPLAIANLLMIGLLIWTCWLPLSMAWSPHTGDAAGWVINILLRDIGFNGVLLLFTAFAFWRKWRSLLLFYIPYSAYMLPSLWRGIEQILNPHILQLSLAGIVWIWTLTALLICTLITALIFIIEHLMTLNRQRTD